jgi:hypothetical protein
MGVDANLYLKPDIKLDDIVDAIGRILGLEERRFGSDETDWSYDGVIQYRPALTIMGMSDLAIPDGRFTGANLNPRFFFNDSYYEVDEEGAQTDKLIRGVSCLHFSSSPLRIALMRRLAQIFGGVLEEHDSRGTMKVFKRPRKRFWNTRHDGEDYIAYKKYLYDIPPLTDEEIEDARESAAYKDGY